MSQAFTWENPDPNVTVFGNVAFAWSLGHEDRALMMELVPL